MEDGKSGQVVLGALKKDVVVCFAPNGSVFGLSREERGKEKLMLSKIV